MYFQKDLSQVTIISKIFNHLLNTSLDNKEESSS